MKHITRWRNIGKRKALILKVYKPGSKFTVFDTETTGIGPDAKIIQFSGIKYRITEDCNIIKESELDIYINPEEKLNPKITEITGIRDDMLEVAENEDYWKDEVFSFLEDNSFLMGYNISFDMRMINQMAMRVKKDIYEIMCLPQLDVLEMARDWVPKSELESHKLSEVTKFLLPDMVAKFHSSIEDAIATMAIFIELLPKYMQYKEEPGKAQVHLEYGSLFINPRKKSEQRIRLKLSEGKLGDVYWDIREKEWGCCTNTAAKQLFNKIDLPNLEEQFLVKYGYKYGYDNPNDVGYAWIKYKKEKDR